MPCTVSWHVNSGSVVVPKGAADRSAGEETWHEAAVGAGGPPCAISACSTLRALTPFDAAGPVVDVDVVDVPEEVAGAGVEVVDDALVDAGPPPQPAMATSAVTATTKMQLPCTLPRA